MLCLNKTYMCSNFQNHKFSNNKIAKAVLKALFFWGIFFLYSDCLWMICRQSKVYTEFLMRAPNKNNEFKSLKHKNTTHYLL